MEHAPVAIGVGAPLRNSAHEPACEKAVTLFRFHLEVLERDLRRGHGGPGDRTVFGGDEPVIVAGQGPRRRNRPASRRARGIGNGETEQPPSCGRTQRARDGARMTGVDDQVSPPVAQAGEQRADLVVENVVVERHRVAVGDQAHVMGRQRLVVSVLLVAVLVGLEIAVSGEIQQCAVARAGSGDEPAADAVQYRGAGRVPVGQHADGRRLEPQEIREQRPHVARVARRALQVRECGVGIEVYADHERPVSRRRGALDALAGRRFLRVSDGGRLRSGGRGLQPGRVRYPRRIGAGAGVDAVFAGFRAARAPAHDAQLHP